MYIPRLKDLREDHDLAQKQVAALLGIDQRVYSNYELGKRSLPLRHLVTLAEYPRTICWALPIICGRIPRAE